MNQLIKMCCGCKIYLSHRRICALSICCNIAKRIWASGLLEFEKAAWNNYWILSLCSLKLIPSAVYVLLISFLLVFLRGEPKRPELQSWGLDASVWARSPWARLFHLSSLHLPLLSVNHLVTSSQIAPLGFYSKKLHHEFLGTENHHFILYFILSFVYMHYACWKLCFKLLKVHFLGDPQIRQINMKDSNC